MNKVGFSVDDKEIQMALVIKLQEIQRTKVSTITYEHLEDILENSIWKKKRPVSLHIAINDILSITAEKVVQYLSSKAIVDGYHKKLSDFEELLGGRINEENK